MPELVIDRVTKRFKHKIAVDTVSLRLRNGVYGIAPDGEQKWHYNIENGLGNNTVLGLMEDKSGNIWVMMDHGISVIHSSLPYSFLKPEAGEPYIGMTYAINRSGDNLYLGTNQGLYTYSFADNTISSNDNARSQIWYIENIDNQILIGGGTLSAEIRDKKKKIHQCVYLIYWD